MILGVIVHNSLTILTMLARRTKLNIIDEYYNQIEKKIKSNHYLSCIKYKT